MTTSTHLGQVKVVTKDGVVTATLVDRVSPERMTQMLIQGAASARYGGVSDKTTAVSSEIRSLLVHPKPDDG